MVAAGSVDRSSHFATVLVCCCGAAALAAGGFTAWLHNLLADSSRHPLPPGTQCAYGVVLGYALHRCGRLAGRRARAHEVTCRSMLLNERKQHTPATSPCNCLQKWHLHPTAPEQSGGWGRRIPAGADTQAGTSHGSGGCCSSGCDGLQAHLHRSHKHGKSESTDRSCSCNSPTPPPKHTPTHTCDARGSTFATARAAGCPCRHCRVTQRC